MDNKVARFAVQFIPIIISKDSVLTEFWSFNKMLELKPEEEPQRQVPFINAYLSILLPLHTEIDIYNLPDKVGTGGYNSFQFPAWQIFSFKIDMIIKSFYQLVKVRDEGIKNK